MNKVEFLILLFFIQIIFITTIYGLVATPVYLFISLSGDPIKDSALKSYITILANGEDLKLFYTAIICGVILFPLNVCLLYHIIREYKSTGDVVFSLDNVLKDYPLAFMILHSLNYVAAIVPILSPFAILLLYFYFKKWRVNIKKDAILLLKLFIIVGIISFILYYSIYHVDLVLRRAIFLIYNLLLPYIIWILTPSEKDYFNS